MSALLVSCCIIALVLGLVLSNRAYIYDWVITSMTTAWYKAALERLPENAHVLDIGIGTGAALIANKDLIREKKLKVVGVDYDKDYVIRCDELIRANGLADSISVHHASIYDFMTPGSATASLPKFDAAYFSGSLMIMPDPRAALVHVSSLLKSPKSPILITQTFETGAPNRVLTALKPLLKFLTTIDFGQVTYEKEFLKTVADAKLVVDDCTSIRPSSALSSVTAKKDRTFKLYTLTRK
jgi:SAM-dependent methyltransferase